MADFSHVPLKPFIFQPTHMEDFSQVLLNSKPFIFQPTHMADFSQVQSIQTSSSENKGILQIKVAGATEPLTITCTSVDDAEDMADLIDGYCRLVHDITSSVWSRKGN